MSKLEAKELVPELRFPEFTQAWSKRCLKDIGTFLGGGTPSKSNPDFWTGLIPWVSSSDISDDSIHQIKVTRFISKDAISKSATKLVPKNTILLVSRVGVGKLAVTTKALCTSQDFANFTPNNDDVYFLAYYLKSKSSEFSMFNQGMAIKGFTKEDISNFVLYIPKFIEEQQKIADCLSSIDDLITANTQKLETLKSYKKGLMQKIFPAEGKSVPELRFSGAENWTKFKLIDVADKNIKWSFIGGPFGSNLKSSDYVEDGIRIIQLQNIGDGQFNEGYKIFTSKEKADELLANNIYPGDIILSKMGDPVGRACFIPETHSRYVMCSDGIRFAVDEDRHSKYFIYSLINDLKFRSTIENAATGSTRKRIGLAELKNLTMLLPAKKEQQKIADCLSSMDDLINSQSQKIETLKSHKKGLMQRLFPVVGAFVQ